MKAKWYHVGVMFKDAPQKYICQLDGDIEKSILPKKDGSFVKLKRVRWLEYDKKKKRNILVKLEDYGKKEYTDCVYVRKELIDSIWPLKSLPIFNK